MAIYQNGKKLDVIYKNGKKIDKIYKNGQVVYSSVGSYKIMTVKIDENISDPMLSCTYADDAVDMIPGSKEWDDFFGHYPVMLKNGVEGKKLNRDDFTKYDDGSNADITSGNDGDVMIAFPRIGLKISKDENRVITVSMTNNPNNPDFEYNAHKRGKSLKKKFYLGAYKGIILDDKMRSLSNATPQSNDTALNLRKYAQLNGKTDGNSSGYDEFGFFQLTFIQAMFIMKYKSLNSQKEIAYGNNLSLIENTGQTNEYSMDSEIAKNTIPDIINDTKHSVKMFGIEDLWGNGNTFIDGITFEYNNDDEYNSSLKVVTDNIFGSENPQIEISTVSIGLNNIIRTIGDTIFGFFSIITKDDGITFDFETNYCDAITMGAPCVLSGGNEYIEGGIGIFGMESCEFEEPYETIRCRLMYL